MPNTNAQAIRVANERFRPFADKMAQNYHFCKAFKDQIAAEGIDSLFAADKEVVDDGAAIDGRSPLTNEDLKLLITAVDAFLGFMDERSELRDTLLRTAVNPLRF